MHTILPLRMLLLKEQNICEIHISVGVPFITSTLGPGQIEQMELFRGQISTQKHGAAHLRCENPEHGVLLGRAGFAGAREADEQHWGAASLGVMPSHLPDQHFSSEGSLKTDSLVMISSSALVSTTAAVQQSHSQRSHLHQMLPASSTISQRVEIGHRYARVCHVCPLPLPAAVDRSSE